MSVHVVVLDAGTGNVRSAVRALQRVGAQVELTADYDAALRADGLFVPGVGAFEAVMQKLLAVRGDRIIERRLAGGQAVLGVCVGLQILFERSTEHANTEEVDAEHADAPDKGYWKGLGQWPGSVELLKAPVVPHMGWSSVNAAQDSQLLRGLDGERFYFVHSYAVQSDPAQSLRAGGTFAAQLPSVSWADYGESRFVAAIEQGALSATQFHPEKSADTGAQLLKNWIESLA